MTYVNVWPISIQPVNIITQASTKLLPFRPCKQRTQTNAIMQLQTKVQSLSPLPKCFNIFVFVFSKKDPR